MQPGSRFCFVFNSMICMQYITHARTLMHECNYNNNTILDIINPVVSTSTSATGMIKFSTVADSLQTIYNRLRNGVCFGGHFLFSELSRANCENACNDQRHLLCTTVALAVNNQIYQRSKSCCLNRWFRVYKRAVAATVFMFATLFISWFSTRRQPLRTTNPYKSRSAPMNPGTLITAPRSKYLPI